MNLGHRIAASPTAENQHDGESVELEELPPLGPGRLRITREIAGKRVRSIYLSYTDSCNVVEVEFADGTSLSVELFPLVELRAESNDWKVENGKVVKSCPRMIAR
jgi:hypothetical protein